MYCNNVAQFNDYAILDSVDVYLFFIVAVLIAMGHVECNLKERRKSIKNSFARRGRITRFPVPSVMTTHPEVVREGSKDALDNDVAFGLDTHNVADLRCGSMKEM